MGEGAGEGRKKGRKEGGKERRRSPNDEVDELPFMRTASSYERAAWSAFAAMPSVDRELMMFAKLPALRKELRRMTRLIAESLARASSIRKHIPNTRKRTSQHSETRYE